MTTSTPLPASPSAAVIIEVDGKSVHAVPGQSVAAALLSAGIRKLRNSPRVDSGRGAFCFMGVCQECAIIIDGTLQQACLTQVHAGQTVELRGAI